MRILGGFAACMVLAVHRDPFARDHAGRQPEPEPEEMADDRVQSQASMSLMTVQKDRDARDGDVRQDQRRSDVSPER
jgi:hypothetical protein